LRFEKGFSGFLNSQNAARFGMNGGIELSAIWSMPLCFALYFTATDQLTKQNM